MSEKSDNKFRSLVVDDDCAIRDALSEILREAGYLVDVAEDGVEALSKVKNTSFDSVLCDVWMPRMNGIDLLREIKKYDFTLPVVIVTGFPDVKIAVEAIKEGASDFITKPVRIEQVEVVIEKMIKERQLLIENAELIKKVEKKRTIEELNKKLHKKIKELSVLYSISETFTEALEGDELFEKIVTMACEITEAGKSSLMILDTESKEMVIRAATGVYVDVIENTRIPLGSGIAGKVALTGEHILMNGFSETPHPRNNRYESDSFICVPLKIKNEVFGVLSVTDRFNGDRFSEEDLYLLLALAKKAAMNLENSILYESIYNNMMDTLKVMVNAIEARDEYTRRHSQRVTVLAMDIAGQMGCSNEEIDTIKVGGFLHDIGKIGIRDSILLKPGKLTKEEYDNIKTHPIIGDNIIKPLGILTVERAIIRHHHERWDGCGYPDGLSGESIPLLARILSVADTFDAMISNRPYRGAKAKEESLDEIESLGGYQFDPEVVNVFKEVFEQKYAL